MNDLLAELRSPRAVTFAILVVAILLSTTGELFLNYGMKQLGEMRFDPLSIVRTLLTPPIFVGFALFFVGALVWLKVLTRVDLSWAYPMLGLGYVLVAIESRFLFKEPVGLRRLAGTLIILLGVSVMYGSGGHGAGAGDGAGPVDLPQQQ